LAAPRVVHDAVCLEHGAFEDLFVGGEGRVEVLEFAEFGLEARVGGLEGELLGMEGRDCGCVGGDGLSDLGDKELAECAEESIFFGVWRDGWNGKGSLIARL
jgi:hypothetical protein